MSKNDLIQLTNNLYRLTLLFPKKEPLRYKMRELADDILANSINNQHPVLIKWAENNPQPILGKLEILDGFFEVAKNQNWVSAVEVLRIQEEYNRIKAEIKKIAKRSPEKEIVESAEVKPLQKEALPTPGVGMNERQQKILGFLRENGRAQVWQLKEVFPEVTKRTLRRDFEFLLKQGKIERIGQRNETFYQLKGRT